MPNDEVGEGWHSHEPVDVDQGEYHTLSRDAAHCTKPLDVIAQGH